jgi:hypothetical protein
MMARARPGAGSADALARRALVWLQADLERIDAELRSGVRLARAVQEDLEHWLADDDLAGLRDGSCRAALAPETRRAAEAMFEGVRRRLQAVGSSETAR